MTIMVQTNHPHSETEPVRTQITNSTTLITTIRNAITSRPPIPAKSIVKTIHDLQSFISSLNDFSKPLSCWDSEILPDMLEQLEKTVEDLEYRKYLAEGELEEAAVGFRLKREEGWVDGEGEEGKVAERVLEKDKRDVVYACADLKQFLWTRRI